MGSKITRETNILFTWMEQTKHRLTYEEEEKDDDENITRNQNKRRY
jgi:hypothetical protein